MDSANKEWWSSIDHLLILEGLQTKIMQFALVDQILLIKSTSENAPLIYNIDIVHIDGNHSEEASMLDVQKWVPLVRQGGFIIFDDINWSTHHGSPVKWLDENCIRLMEFKDGSDWGVWIKP